MRTILSANSKPNCNFQILSNPEFLAEGTAITDLLNPDRILIGSLQTQDGINACESLKEIYANWISYVFYLSSRFHHVDAYMKARPYLDRRPLVLRALKASSECYARPTHLVYQCPLRHL